MTNKLIYYSQEDPRWRNVMYSNHGDKTQTIGTSGCGPSSAAMAISSLTGREVLPPEAAKYAADRGYRTYNDGTAWGFFATIAKEYGLLCMQTARYDDAKAALAAGKLVVASMRPGHFTAGGHYVLLVGIRGGLIEVYDPNHDNTKYGADGLIDQDVRNDGKVKAKESVIRTEAGQYWIFDKEDEGMTEAEKQAFEALQDTVKQQGETIKSQAEQLAALNAHAKKAPAPAWFVKEFGSGDLGGLITSPVGDETFWRAITIILRAAKAGKLK